MIARNSNMSSALTIRSFFVRTWSIFPRQWIKKGPRLKLKRGKPLKHLCPSPQLSRPISHWPGRLRMRTVKVTRHAVI
jgi:hypothetical protein